jgi:hypothetical protein
MSVYQGFISKIAVKQGIGRRGPWKLYSGRVEKDDGTEYAEWLSFGFDQPSCKEGDYVKLTAEADAKGYQQVNKIEILKNPPAKATPVAQAGASAASSYVSGKDASIHYQSARKDAITVVQALISMDALPITSAKTKAGEAKRYEEIMALVDKLTVRYFNDTQTQRILDSVVDEGANEDESAALPGNTEEVEDDQ